MNVNSVPIPPTQQSRVAPTRPPVRSWLCACAAIVFVMAAGISTAQPPGLFYQGGAPTGQEIALPAVVDGTASVLTLYSEARFWGDRFATQIFPEPVNATDEVITSTQLYVANLLGRISSVRLQCGSRDSHVMLYTGRPTSSQIEQWPPSGIGYPVSCTANSITRVNLHTEALRVADKVASVYFVVHAPDVEYADLSQPVDSNWARLLPDRLPDGAKAKGKATLQFLSSFSVKLTQKLRLDHWACTGRTASFELSIRVRTRGPTRFDPNNYFDVGRGRVVVDDGFGDAWGCRDKMLDKLRAGADAAADDLDASLDRLADFRVPGHARYYLIPQYGLSDFWLVGGGGSSGN